MPVVIDLRTSSHHARTDGEVMWDTVDRPTDNSAP